jgi:6-phosphogluconolactonase
MKTNLFQTQDELNEALMHQFSVWINESIAQYDQVNILLSGGSTPQKFYALLSEQDLPWHKILFGLVDERYVLQSNKHSNESMIRGAMASISDQLSLVTMVVDVEHQHINLMDVNKHYKPFIERVDIALLGMGTDGHTASIFPGDPRSEELLTSNALGIFYTTSPQAPHERLTCSPAMLAKSRHGVILLHGEEKSRIFNLNRLNPLPIDHFKELTNFEHYISMI